MTNDDLDGMARGHLRPDWRHDIRVPVFTSGPQDGQVHERLLLERLQQAGLVSNDVRSIYVEPAADGDGWLVMDVDTSDSIATFWLPAGAGF